MEKVKMIETYLDGSMRKEERVKFEQAIIADPELAAEVKLHMEVNEAILGDDIASFREILSAFVLKSESKINPQFEKIVSFIKMPIAATILLLIGLSIWKTFSPISPGDLFNDNYKPYQTDISTRSVQQSKEKIQLAYLLYQEGEYETSSEILSNYLEKNYTNQTAHFYYALNAIELNQIQKAINILIPIENDPYTPFSLHARWYLALTYIEIGDNNKAGQYLRLLIENENMYSDRANKILKKMKS